MASHSEIALQAAIASVERAFARLDAVSDIAAQERAEAVTNREAQQAEISQGWQQHAAQLEAALADAQAESEFLKAENARLVSELQASKHDYAMLQETAGHAAIRLDATVKQLDLILEH